MVIASDKDLLKGLQQWKKKRLQEIEEDMLELNQGYVAAQNGLGVVHRNPGEVKPDLVEYLWQKLNRTATELERLEREHQDLMEMDLPRLIVEYKRKRKEPPRWAFERL